MRHVKRSNGKFLYRLMTALVFVLLFPNQFLVALADPNFSFKPASQTIALKDNILPILQQGQAQLLAQVQPTQMLDIGLSLNLHNTQLLNEWLREVYTPDSSNFGKFLTAQQFDNLFAPTQADQDAVTNYLQSQGLTVYKTFDNHGLVRAKGTVLQVQNALGVSINNYRANNGRVFYANAEPPRLPASIAGTVLNVQGLENFVKPQSYNGATTPKANNVLSRLKAQILPKATTGGGPNGGLTPSQWQSFYNFSTLYGANIKGQGQVLALTAFDTYNPADFKAFLQQYGLPTVPVEIRGAGTVAYPNPGTPNELEVISDMEMAAATAPAMTKLVLYEDIDLVTMFQEFVNDRVASVLSNSYGIPCDTAQPTSYLAAQTQVLQQAAAQGQTVVGSSGDDLAYSCSNPSVPASSQNNNPSIGTPDDNPWVLTIGGTSINFATNPTSATLSYTSESVWNCPQSDTISNCQGTNTGSTGGVSSTYFAQPWWQKGVTDSVLNTTGRVGRATPDVALYADVRNPNDPTIEPGYSVYCSDQANCADNPGWLQVGGTSTVTPMLAGLVCWLIRPKARHWALLTPPYTP